MSRGIIKEEYTYEQTLSITATFTYSPQPAAALSRAYSFIAWYAHVPIFEILDFDKNV